MRCLAWSLSAYFTPKSSTTRLKEIGRQTCVQKPGVSLLCLNPFAFNLFSNSSCTSIPYCNNPYIPFTNFDIDVAILRDLISEFVLLNEIFREVLWFEPHVFVSQHWSMEIETLDVNGQDSPPCVKTTLLMSSLTVSMFAVCSAVTGVVYSDPTNGESHLIWILLLQALAYNYSPIRAISTSCSG